MVLGDAIICHESGCRVGELLTPRLKHVSFDQHGARLIVQGKTGMRRVRVIASAPPCSRAGWRTTH